MRIEMRVRYVKLVDNLLIIIFYNMSSCINYTRKNAQSVVNRREQCCAAKCEQCYAANCEQCCAANCEQCCAANCEQCCTANCEQCCTANCEQCCSAVREQCCQQSCLAMITCYSIVQSSILLQDWATMIPITNKLVLSILFSPVSTIVNFPIIQNGMRRLLTNITFSMFIKASPCSSNIFFKSS